MRSTHPRRNPAVHAADTDAHLRSQFTNAFIESLYPELKRGRVVIAEEDDEEEDDDDEGGVQN